MHQTDFFTAIYNELNQGRPAVLATICACSGSTPRKTGSRMALLGDSFIGTVGGGALEARVERTMRQVQQDGGHAMEHFQLTNEQAAEAGMICGGDCSVLIEQVVPEAENKLVFQEFSLRLSRGKGQWLAVKLKEGGPVEHFLADTAELPKAVISITEGKRRAAMVESDCPWFLDPIFPVGQVVFVGGGHVALASARLAREAGFDVVVLDDREEFANDLRFPFVRHVGVVPEYSQCFNNISIRPEDFICIMTRGHIFDGSVLGQALETPARFVGMIGSTRKREAIFSELSRQGVDTAELERVRCPIGLDIGAESPAEIAVSIVAQLIQERGAR